MTLNIKQKFLTPNKYSRPQTKLKGVKGIVLHWWAVANGSVNGVWNFYENRKNGKSSYGSAHFIVGLDGEILQCLPENEVAYAVGAKKYYTDKLGDYPNNQTLHIEMAHVDMQGHMTKETWNTSVELTAHLLKKYGLGINDIYTHHFISRKDCPKLFVNEPSEYQRFKNDVAKVLKGQSVTQSTEQTKPKQESKPIEQKPNLQEAMKMKMIDVEGINDYNLQQLEIIYREAREQGLLNDDRWEKKAKSKEIQVGEVAFLTAILDHRRFNQVCNKK